MSLARYKERKAMGLVSVAKIGDAYAISIRKFDPETGEEIAPVVEALSLAQLEAQRQQLQESIDNLSDLIADVESLSSEEEEI